MNWKPRTPRRCLGAIDAKSIARNHRRIRSTDFPLPSSALPSQAQAWIHALTPGPQARLRLAECLADGVDPWQRTAVVDRWSTTSVSLPEAVLMGAGALGMEEARKRLALIGRYTSVAENAQQQSVALTLLESAMTARVPLPDLTLWRNRAGALTDEQSQALARRGLEIALEQGGEDGAELMGWIHRRVLAWTQWPAAMVVTMETSEDAPIRDSYWALVRQAPTTSKPIRPGGPA